MGESIHGKKTYKDFEQIIIIVLNFFVFIVFLVSSEDTKNQFHQRTKRANECELVTAKEGEEDPIVEKLSKIGCLEQHYKVQDCYFDTKDWRKCTREVKEFQDCIKKSKKQPTQ